MDLTETEDITQKWQEYTEVICKTDCHDPDNHNGRITYLESDILEYEIKWTLGCITRNKVSRGDRIPVEIFQTLKMMQLKCSTQYTTKFRKFSSGHRAGKGQVLFHSHRNAMSQTTTELHLSHTQVK